ncbi:MULTISPECIES: lipopolysaccharide biosynthesis protein [unclassified Bacteroides]|jgi:O-antigen/teichoic acid export membrane protein|uniref:lipopolysaccharide biosynthesis protein n=1 Tax=unclassified Bacteroides TaxID=2646097 RepID=UPI000E97EFA0|nr:MULTISPECIES: lipopolysaccharide biosynthesis protein [unclassified Bacteroides]RGN51431.1 lipopolysaccharide biosynthesis protein [Bacteroides sp. OM05-12]RHR78039.1 lipopolysaccharide biosynthesis protein [Bacteroides sp. AF16-49]
MAEQSLKDKTAKGLFWGGLSNGLLQFLNLFFGVFLARILTPADYGMIGMLTIFSLIAGSLQESGFIAALANKKEVVHKDYNAVFWFSTGLSFCLYIILFFCAPLIADFYHVPELTALSRYSFLGFFIASLGTAQSAFLFRNLMVKQKAMSSVIALIFSGIVGVLLASLGFAYWGIATQNLVYVATVTVCYWCFSSWRPTFHLDFTPLKGMLSFSSKLLLTNIFGHINNNLFSVILGKFYSETEVGYFGQANKWNMMGHSLITGMVNGVAQPVLAQVSDDKERQSRVFRKMLRFTAFISFPAMFGLSLVAPELITIAITDKWAASAEILRLLCISGAFIPIITLYSNLLISKGKSNVYMWNTICLGMTQLLVMLLLYPYGIHTMVLVYVLINIVWLLVWHYFVWREIRLRLFQALKDIMPFAVISGGIMIATYYITLFMQNIYLLFVSKVIIASSLYMIIMWCSGSITFKESMQYVRHR